MQLGWIDFSKTERNKILNVLDMLTESGTLDELGIAPIRDGFSNLFFPGTSTIQTRAKYFFIVPYALKQLEHSSETNPNRILRQIDAIEHECGERLLEQHPGESGIIGKRSLQNGKWVKRTPADIYWAGLRKYGIFTADKLSLTEYVRVSCQLKNNKTTLHCLGNRNDNAEDKDHDDKDAGNLFSMQFWKIPRYDSNWQDQLEMRLTQEEGEFLRQQIIDRCKGSMLAYILENDLTEFLDCPSFRYMDMMIEKFPTDIQEDYMLAKAFSDFIYVIRTIYNIIISEGQNEEANMEYERLLPELKTFADVDIDHIMQKLDITNNPGLRSFLNKAKAAMLVGDIESLKQYIIAREKHLKGANRAKTAHPGEFDPDVWMGGKGLDYRFFNARTIIKDIMESEGLLDAES